MRFQSIYRNTSIASAMLLLALTISGCGDRLSGHKYAEQGGLGSTLEFKSGKQANYTYMGTTYAGTYSVDGNQITIDTAGGPFGKFVATIQSDGSITGLPPLDITVKKAD